jgi:hypothetical protein
LLGGCRLKKCQKEPQRSIEPENREPKYSQRKPCKRWQENPQQAYDHLSEGALRSFDSKGIMLSIVVPHPVDTVLPLDGAANDLQFTSEAGFVGGSAQPAVRASGES